MGRKWERILRTSAAYNRHENQIVCACVSARTCVSSSLYVFILILIILIQGKERINAKFEEYETKDETVTFLASFESYFHNFALIPSTNAE